MEFARDEDGDGFHEVHVNTMEGFWLLLCSWLRPHRGISKEKLPWYLGFFEFIHNVRQRGKALLHSLLSVLLAHRILLRALFYTRIIAVIYLLFATAYQWLRGKPFFPYIRTNKIALLVKPQMPAFILGLAFSIIPYLAGLILFVLGAPLMEFSVYCLAFLISGFLWVIYRFPSYPKAEELDIPPEEKIIP